MNALIFLLLSFNPAHVTYEWAHIPGSISIDYTGVRKVIIRETIDFLSSEWTDRTSFLFNEGEITYEEYRSSLTHLYRTVTESKLNGKYWERDWWHSLPPDKGGAKHLRHYVVGRTGDFIDLGIAHLNQDFKFKLKEYRKNLSNEWKFKFKPHIVFSSSKWIRVATCSFSFTYTRRNIRRFRFILTAGYKRDLDGFAQLTIEMLNI